MHEVSGAPFMSVYYSVPPDGVSQYPDTGIHEVDHAVILTFGSHNIRVSWSIDGYREGLITESSPSRLPSLGESLRDLEVSGIAPWKRLQGATFKSLSFRDYTPEVGSPPVPWAARFDFIDAPSFVIALGEIVESEIEYHPQSLVVIFDEAIARAYRPFLGSGTSWGTS
ncbi:hypothetical protein ACGFI3_46295 [Nonomuraea wenchangensis]|uniref:hypothetical protein n=1 Tax=Nonomuraea wenchangensis TaxID=568860 RepID=UPI00372186FC